MGDKSSQARRRFVSFIPAGVWRIALQIIAASFFIMWTVAPAHTQGGWSLPEELLEPQDGWLDIGTTMIADQSGLAHLMWLHQPEEDAAGGAAFYYSRWDGMYWTPPVDVFAASDAYQLGWPVLVPAPDGWLEVFWNTGSFLYHSRAWASNADSPRAWRTPDIVLGCDDPCSTPVDAALDSEGILHVVFAKRTGDVFYIRSEDKGEIWSSPIAVSSVARETSVFLPKLAVAVNGLVHVVWAEVQLPDGPTLRVNYARSDDGGVTWSSPLELGGRHHSDGNVMTLENNIVYVAWNGGIGAGGGRYFQGSSDGGVTWTPPIRFSAGAGWAGYPSMALDSAGVLHILTGQGEYRAWDGRVWFPPVTLPPVDINIEHSRLAVVGGNQLLAIWPLSFQGIYFASRQVDAPALPTRLAPTPTPRLLITPTPTGVATITHAHPVSVQDDVMSETRQVSATWPIVVSVGASLLVVSVGIFLHAYVRRR